MLAPQSDETAIGYFHNGIPGAINSIGYHLAANSESFASFYAKNESSFLSSIEKIHEEFSE